MLFRSTLRKKKAVMKFLDEKKVKTSEEGKHRCWLQVRKDNIVTFIHLHILENDSATISQSRPERPTPELFANSYVLSCESIQLEPGGLLGIGLIFPMKA